MGTLSQLVTDSRHSQIGQGGTGEETLQQLSGIIDTSTPESVYN